MHILAINGSHRGDKGWTRFLIDCLGRGATEAGATCEVVTLAKLKINRCLSCYQCQQDAHHLHCVYEDKDDAAGVMAKMAAADLLIYATPIYMMSLSSLLKTFLDRLYSTMHIADMQLSESGLVHHHINPAISSKPFAALIVSSNIEDASWRNAAHYFRTYARFMNAPLRGLLIRNATPLLDAARDPDKAKRLPKVAQVYAAYEQAGRELASGSAIHPLTLRRANQEIVPVPLFGLLKHLRPVKQLVIENTANYTA